MTGVAEDPRLERLAKALDVGIGADAETPRTELALAESTDDRDIAHTLVQVIAAAQVAHAGVGGRGREGTGKVRLPASASADSSFMGQLMSHDGDAIRVEEMTDVDTLLAVARGGTLGQRRAALVRIGQLAEYRVLSADATRIVTDGLLAFHDMALAYEVNRAQLAVPGGGGRAARASRDHWQRIVQDAEQAIMAFWEEQRPTEPIAEMPGADRAQLLLRVRDLPDTIVAHLGALCEATDGVGGSHERRDILAALRHAGDPRLVPAFVYVLQSGGDALIREASRALARIDDPRVLPALREAYGRNASDDTRLVLAGALGLAGDARGAEEVWAALDRDEPSLLPFVLEALEHLGTADHAERVVRHLESEDPAIRGATIELLARLADSRALGPLEDLRRRTRLSAERAEAEEAMAAIAARMELRGEEAIVPDPVETREAAGADDDHVAPARQRLRAYWNYLVGTLWIALGAVSRATARWEIASSQRAGWTKPLVAMGLALAKRRHHAQALNAYRRAISSNRIRVERNPLVITSVARSFLRRAEEMDRGGRHDIARGLVAEVLALDLRRAPSALRFELQRMHDALGRRST